MITLALLLAAGLDCGKVEVNTRCYILQRDVPTTIVDKTVLTYVDLNDSRCPLDVLCKWAGFVVASFDLEAADGTVQTLSLRLDPRTPGTNYYVDEATGYTVTLNEVAEHNNGPIPEGQDQVKITISKTRR